MYKNTFVEHIYLWKIIFPGKLRELRFSRNGKVYGIFQVWQVFFRRDARRACRGATCHTQRSDFRVPRQAMVGVGFGV